MTKVPSRALGFVLVALVIVVAAEAFGLSHSGEATRGDRIAHPSTAANANSSAFPDAAQTEKAGAWAATMLARPLLDPTRRPVSGGDGPAAAVDGPAAMPRLAGVMVGPFGRSAIFAPLTGKPVTVSEGGHVGPFVIRRIEAGKVTVTGPDGETVVRPRMASSPRA